MRGKRCGITEPPSEEHFYLLSLTARFVYYALSQCVWPRHASWMLRASKLSRVRAAALTHDGLRQLDGCMIVAIPRNAIR
jgi:hypothetical protein